jgi:photosystem II stability/assembly factor-like uncharacterized protein
MTRTRHFVCPVAFGALLALTALVSSTGTSAARPSGATRPGVDRLVAEANYVRRIRALDDRHAAAERLAAVQSHAEAEAKVLAAASPLSVPTWKPIGPAPIPNGSVDGGVAKVSGRVTAIAVDPANPSIAFVGTADGGVFRTLNGGTNWTPMLDSAASLAIGAIAIAPSQPSTVYVGTGEPNLSGDSSVGVGLYRIDNADSTPTLTGPIDPAVTFNVSGGPTPLQPFFNASISKILVDPTDPATILVATQQAYIDGIVTEFPNTPAPYGLYRSSNATATGGSIAFQRLTVTTARSVDNPPTGGDSIGDIVFDPANPNTVVATAFNYYAGADEGIYRSTNALAATPTFTETYSVSPVTGDDRTLLAIDHVGSTVTVLAGTGGFGAGSVLKSTDGGVTWPTALSAAAGFCKYQCWYDIALAIDPNNAQIILIGATSNYGLPTMERSVNGGATFSADDHLVHTDVHAIVMAPSNPLVVWTGNDGGVWESTNEGKKWLDRNTAGFQATQFESIAVHPTDPYYTIGGTQDNGTNRYDATKHWSQIAGGDGGSALIDQGSVGTASVRMYHTFSGTNPAYQWSSDGGATWFDTSGINPNDRALFYPPMARGPGSPNTVYYATNRIYRSTDGGQTNTDISGLLTGREISAVGVAPQDDNTRLVGTDLGRVFHWVPTSNSFTDITGPWPSGSYVARTVIDPNTAARAYVTLDTYSGTSSVWMTTNLGATAPTWSAVGSSLPVVPVNSLVVDPNNSNKLFAGTDIGVYRSTDGGATWAPYGKGLPVVPVFDMAIAQPGTVQEILRIATHGRGMWRIAA